MHVLITYLECLLLLKTYFQRIPQTCSNMDDNSIDNLNFLNTYQNFHDHKNPSRNKLNPHISKLFHELLDLYLTMQYSRPFLSNANFVTKKFLTQNPHYSKFLLGTEKLALYISRFMHLTTYLWRMYSIYLGGRLKKFSQYSAYYLFLM